MPIIRRRRHAEVNTRVETKVFVDLIRQPGIYSAHPIGVLLRAHIAEKFHSAGQFAEEVPEGADRNSWRIKDARTNTMRNSGIQSVFDSNVFYHAIAD